MTSAVESIVPASTSASVKLPVVDCDVHVRLRSVEQLYPYLDEVWHGHKPMFAQLPYDLGPLNGDGQRDDTWPALHGHPEGRPGSSYELMVEQLLDHYDMAAAILNGSSPSVLEAQQEYAVALASAYNDLLIAEWLERDERLYGSVAVAYQDPQAAAAEIDRVGAHPKMVQVLLPVTSQLLGGKRFRPIFEAAARHDLVIAMHQTATTPTAVGYPPYYSEWHVGLPQSFMAHVANLVFSGVLDEFPNLRVVMLEGDFTWVPCLRWRMDANWKALRVETPWLERKPSEVLREHFFFATQPMPEPETQQQLLKMVELTGEDSLVFATDYPHWDFDADDKVLPVGLFGTALRNKIANTNATQRLYAGRIPPAD